MARKKTSTLTEAERRLMAVVWDKGEATVNDVIDALPGDYRPAYNTVLTTMRILEEKGYVQHEKDGRAHVYKPLISQKQARLQVIRHMVQGFFEGSPALLLQNILENETMTDEELEQLRAMVDRSDEER